MANPIEAFEKKKDTGLAAEYEQEAAEFGKMFTELKSMSPEQRGPLEEEMQSWAAGYNLRIRKLQRDSNLYLGGTPQEREENSKKLEKLIIADMPVKAYITYLKKELDHLLERYDQLKKEHDQFKQEQGDLLKKADAEKDPVKSQALRNEAHKKGEEQKKRKWMIQNDVASRLSPDLEKDMLYIEKIVGAIPKTAGQDIKPFNTALADMRKSLQELQKKTQQDRISSEDRIAWFPSQP